MSYMRDLDGKRLDEFVVADNADLTTEANDRTAADATLQTEIDALGVAGVNAFNTLTPKMRLGLSTNVGIAGDSTANKTYEWALLALTEYAADFPRLSVDYAEWNGATYNTTIPLSTGVAGRVTVFRDEFNRVAADLIGSTPDVGTVWTVGGLGAGDWSLDGSDAVASADASRGFAFATVPAGDIEVTTTALVPASQVLRHFIKFVDSSNYLAAYVSKNGSGGQYRLQLIQVIAGVQTTLADSSFFFVNPQIPEEDLTIRVQVVGDRWTGSINGVFTGATLSAPAVAATTASTKTGIWGSAVTGVRVRRFQADTLLASTGGTMTVYNGSQDGSILSYQEGLVATLYPSGTPLDLLIVNSGHNYGSASPATYLAAIDSFVAAFRTQQASTPISISSQNPRMILASDIAAHALRMEALPDYTTDNGYGYFPTFEAMVEASVGYDLSQSDGVHPTGGWSGGAGVQAAAALTYNPHPSVEVALNNHVTNKLDAHRASAISNVPAGTIAATDVQTAINELDTEKAALASPTFTGTPVVPTAAPGTNTTQAASTAFVAAAGTAQIASTITDGDTTHTPDGNSVFDALALKAPLASPALTGNPTAPTPALGDNDTSVATTAFAQPRFIQGTTATAIGTAAKTVTISGYTPTTGDVLALTFTNGNTGTSPTLDINGGGAVAIAIAGNTTNSFSSINLAAGATILLYYSGSRWEAMGPQFTMSAVDQATAEAGSSTTVQFWSSQRVRQNVAAATLPTSTSAALNAIGNAVNTAGKYAGKTYFNTTTSKLATAVGSTAGSVWVDATGATTHTPV